MIKKEVQYFDGCLINCDEAIMKESGFLTYRYINATDFGFIKGKKSVTEEKIDEIFVVI